MSTRGTRHATEESACLSSSSHRASSVSRNEGTADFYLVIDFEATCNMAVETRLQQCSRNEVIEWPCVLLDSRSLRIVDEFHEYVRPVEVELPVEVEHMRNAYTHGAHMRGAYTHCAYTQNAYTQSAYTQNAYTQSAYTQSAYTQSAYTQSPYTQSAYTQNPYAPLDPWRSRQLSVACSNLTGIQQSQVDGADALGDVLARFMRWLDGHGLVEQLLDGRARLVTHGEWDIGDQLRVECARKGIALPLCLRSFLDVKVPFLEMVPHGTSSIAGMLRAFGMEQVGRSHSGIDDSRNIAQVLSRLLSQGADTRCTHVVQFAPPQVGVEGGDGDCLGSELSGVRGCGGSGKEGVANGEKGGARGGGRSGARGGRRSRAAGCDDVNRGSSPGSSKGGGRAGGSCARSIDSEECGRGRSSGESGASGGGGGGSGGCVGGGVGGGVSGGMLVALRPLPKGRPGDWHCAVCRVAVNFGRNSECYRCGHPRPLAPALAQHGTPASPPPGAHASEVGAEERNSSDGGNISSPSQSERGVPHARHSRDWHCAACGAVVFGRRRNCYRCLARNPSDEHARSSSDMNVRSSNPHDGAREHSVGSPAKRGVQVPSADGHWDCPKCTLQLFTSTAQCFQCGQIRPTAS